MSRGAVPQARPRECPAIRRLLWSFLAAILVAAPVAAQVSAVATAETWAAPGTPGGVDDVHLGHGLPFAWLGLVAGAVGSRDALVAGTGAWPGLDELQAPGAWYDSSRVVIGADAGWRGYAGSLVTLQSDARPVRTGKPRAAFTYVTGAAGADRNGLLLARGDGNGWLRAGALAERRDVAGRLGLAGRHLWFVDVGQVRGAGTLRVNFTQRGNATTTLADASEVDLIGGLRPPYPGYEDAAHGEAGFAEWAWSRHGRRATVRATRSHDHRESFESPVLGVQSLFAEREAQQNGLEFEAAREQDGRTDALRLELTEARVARSADYFFDGVTPRLWRQRTVWLAGRRTTAFAGGALEGQLGLGAQRAVGGLGVAPSLEWRGPMAGSRVRVHAGRHLTPVWSDLAPGTDAFTQDVWLVGAEDAWGDRAHRWLELGVLGARIGSPAGLDRTPVRDVALRRGWTRLGASSHDAMVTLGLGARRGTFGVDASGFARVRPRVAFEALTEPAIGARVGVESAFRLFTGDLGVTVRLEGAYVGARECASLPEYSVRPLPVAATTTWGGSLMLELGDARFGFRAFDLEDVAHPLAWADPSRAFPGAAAVSAGRQIRFELAWPFFN